VFSCHYLTLQHKGKQMNKNSSCCANCGFMGMPVLNRCSHCGYIGKRLPLIELQYYEHEKLFIEMANYNSNSTKALFIQSLESDEDSFWLEPFVEVTTNLEGAEKFLGENEILVKTWSENESLIQPLLASGYFEDTGKRVDVSAWCKASIWKVIQPIPQNIQPKI